MSSARLRRPPLTRVCLSVLASQVSMIVQFFSEHATERRRIWRKIYEDKRRNEGACVQADRKHDLVEEMGFLQRLAEQEDKMSRTYDLVLSLLGFVTFWMVGAAAYQAIEGWTFGNSVYYCYVTFFTIGFVSVSKLSSGSI